MAEEVRKGCGGKIGRLFGVAAARGGELVWANLRQSVVEAFFLPRQGFQTEIDAMQWSLNPEQPEVFQLLKSFNTNQDIVPQVDETFYANDSAKYDSKWEMRTMPLRLLN